MTTIAERYQLVDRIGSGAMGDVYRAIDLETEETVAVKHLKAELVQRAPVMLERFLREGETLRELNHPNIVKLLDSVEEEDEHYLILEYMPGGDLADLIHAAPQGLPLDQTLSIALDLADALTRAHRLNIIHRDLKPANVLIAEDGTPRLTDFGIARVVDLESVTAPQEVIGTVAYMSPEALMGQALDERTDIWSFGVLLYEMLTGKRPFESSNPAGIMSSILGTQPPDLLTARGDIPLDLIDLVYRMLQKSREPRIPSVRLVGAEIEAIAKKVAQAEAGPVSAPAPEPAGDRFAPYTQTVTDQVRHNLPGQVVDFVGRQDELDALKRLLLEEKRRLVTILGPGGIGKSRLALEAGLQTLGEFAHGTFFVDLAALSDASHIPNAIADATGYPFHGEVSPREQIIQYLANKRMLLLMDNFEHLLDGTGLVDEILQAAPELSIVATSREKLNLIGETVFTLPGLDFPVEAMADDALSFSAMQLFLQSARRTRVDFELHEDEIAPLVTICQLVEGIPLGILLAAAWVDVLSVEEIAEEVSQSVDFLESDAANLPERQRSMRRVFGYSWNLLSDEERAAFANMSVFRGGCSRKAAQTVTGASLRMLLALVGKSLLQRDAASGRFSIHELLRQLGAEHLESTGTTDTMQDAHADYYLRTLGEKEADLKGRDQLKALDDIESDFDNIRMAWRRACQHRQAENLGPALKSLYLFAHIRSRFQECQTLCETALAAFEGAPGAESDILWAQLVSHQMFPFTITAEDRPQLEQALVVAEAHGDQEEIAFCSLLLGAIALREIDVATALPLMERSLALYEELDDLYFQALGYEYRANLMIIQGDWQTAEKDAFKALDMHRRSGDRAGSATTLSNMSASSLRNAKFDMAYQLLSASNLIHREMRNRQGVAWTNVGMAMKSLHEGDFDTLERLCRQALKIARDINHGMTISYAQGFLSVHACVRGDYEEAASRAEESVRLAENLHTMLVSTWASGLASAGLGDVEGARREVLAGTEITITRGLPALTTWYLPTLIYILHADGQPERAAEVLGLLLGHPMAPLGWIEGARFSPSIRSTPQ